MPPDLPNDQELTLKKRARRRLVGAVALVLLMIIVLPQILQDRALLAQQEPIKITMPETANKLGEQVAHNNPVADVPAIQQPEPLAEPAPVKPEPDVAVPPVAASAPKASETPKTSETKVAKEPEVKKTVAAAPAVQSDKPVVQNVVQSDKKTAASSTESAKPEEKASVKAKESFTVQVGVYSDVANVKRLQEQLKKAGFSTHTEKVKTSKGESLRLKAGSFDSRPDAVAALDKIKEIGLSGIVVSNE